MTDLARQFLVCVFRPEDTRTYTYHNDGEPVAVGDKVSVPARKGGTSTVIVTAITSEVPTFETKPIMGKVMGAADIGGIADGIYFDMDGDAYHSIERYSTSGIQKTLVSPADFWESSWLNPDRAGPDEDATKAQILGRAYHIARLEPERFDSLYCRALDKADMPEGTLFTGTEMGAALATYKAPKSGSVMEQADRLREVGHEGTLWHHELAKWEAERGNRIGLSAKDYNDVVRDMARIRSVPEVAELLTDGVAEVSVFWTCPRTQIPMKARLDYLKANAWADLKTFANPNGKNVEEVISDSFKYNRYHVQATNYDEAVEAIRHGAVHIVGNATEAQRALVAAIQLRPERLECWFVFQQKAGVPNIFAKLIRFYEVPINIQAQHAGASPEAIAKVEKATETPQLWFNRARREILKAKRLYKGYSQIYSRGEPWRPFNPLGEISDLSFNAFWLDQEIGE